MRLSVKIGRMNKKKHEYQILLTNDDGIQSPGLWAAAEALSKLGFVTVVAPREQASATGRSMPVSSDGKIEPTRLNIGPQEWTTYAVGGTPGQAVQHAVLEIVDTPPDLIVSGINSGENLGNTITISGTVGAALEGASVGIPSMAVSLQTNTYYLHHDKDVDFAAASHFTHLFSAMMLKGEMPDDVDVLKVDIPISATPRTSWRVTRLSKHRYYTPFVQRPGSWAERGFVNARAEDILPDEHSPDTDIYTVLIDKKVSVTPLSLDMTSRVELESLDQILRQSLENNPSSKMK